MTAARIGCFDEALPATPRRGFMASSQSVEVSLFFVRAQFRSAECLPKALLGESLGFWVRAEDVLLRLSQKGPCLEKSN